VDSAHVHDIHLRRPDILPTGAMRASCQSKNNYGNASAQASGHGKNRQGWVPYRSIACWYLWKSLECEDDMTVAGGAK